MLTTAMVMILAMPTQAMTPWPRHCADANRTVSAPTTATPRKLGEEPPASQIYAVYNHVDGCPQPVVVRDGIGANTHRRAPVVRTVPKARRVE